MTRVDISGASASVRRYEELTVGRVGAQVEFVFNEEWDGLTKTAVFRQGNVVRDVVGVVDTATIPHEVLKQAGIVVEIGVYGTNAEGTVVIPTVWAKTKPVKPGADPSGDESTVPDLPVWEQILTMIGSLENLDTDAKENLVAAINEAFSGTLSYAEMEDEGVVHIVFRDGTDIRLNGEAYAPLTIDDVTYQGLSLREIFETHNLVIGGDFENGLPSLQIGDNTWEFKGCSYTGTPPTYIDDGSITIAEDDYSDGKALKITADGNLRALCLDPRTFNIASAGYYFIACQTRIDEWNGSGGFGFQGTINSGVYPTTKGDSFGAWQTIGQRVYKSILTYDHTIFLGALPRSSVYPTVVGWIDNLAFLNLTDIFGSGYEPSENVCKRLYELYQKLKKTQSARDYMAVFVDEMNRKAAELGMSNSSFANPSGMFSVEDEASEGTGNNYSTAADVMKLGLAMLGNPQLMDILKTGRYMCATGGNNRREVTTAGIMNGTGYSTLASRGYLLMGGKGGSGVGALTGQTSVEAWVSYDADGNESSGYGKGIFNMLATAAVGDRQVIVSLLGGLDKQTDADGKYIDSDGNVVTYTDAASVPNWPIIGDVLDVIYELLNGKNLSEITIGGSLADGLGRETYPISVTACVVPSGNTGSWAGYPTASILSNWTSYAANEDEVKTLMSISKVLTALVVLENVDDLNERVTILESDYVDGSGQLFYEGETLTIRDLLYITLLESNNMTATTLGRVVGEKILKQGRARFLTPTTETMKEPAVYDPVYELIETITVSEAAVITRTEEPDGTPYKFDAMFVDVSGTAEMSGMNFDFFSDGTLVGRYWMGCSENGNSGLEIEKDRGWWKATRLYTTSGSVNYGVPYRSRTYAFAHKTAEYPHITKFTTNSSINAGVTLKIYGVRAR